MTIKLELQVMLLVMAGLSTKSEEVDKGPTITWGPEVQHYHVGVKMSSSNSLNNSFKMHIFLSGAHFQTHLCSSKLPFDEHKNLILLCEGLMPVFLPL